MANGIRLLNNNRLVTSPFGLVGTDENALTFALGYIFQHATPLLIWFLKEIEIHGVRARSLKNVQIHLQRRRNNDWKEGITDIEIRLPGAFHVIVEAKVGFATPSLDQCSKYLQYFNETNEPIQKLITLVQATDKSFVDKYISAVPEFSARLRPFDWLGFLSECVRLIMSKELTPESKWWISSFYGFLDREYGMKAYTTEVWILPISTDPIWPGGLSYWDIHQKHLVWWDYREHTVRPLYLGFRVNGVLDSIRRVIKIEHDVPIIKKVPELSSVNAEWPAKPASIWHFAEPVKLPRQIRTGGGMYSRRVRCNLDLLLTCQTVVEIEEVMGKRRSDDESSGGN